jgi:hypothetical protein
MGAKLVAEMEEIAVLVMNLLQFSNEAKAHS